MTNSLIVKTFKDVAQHSANEEIPAGTVPGMIYMEVLAALDVELRIFLTT